MYFFIILGEARAAPPGFHPRVPRESNWHLRVPPRARTWPRRARPLARRPRPLAQPQPLTRPRRPRGAHRVRLRHHAGRVPPRPSGYSRLGRRDRVGNPHAGVRLDASRPHLLDGHRAADSRQCDTVSARLRRRAHAADSHRPRASAAQPVHARRGPRRGPCGAGAAFLDSV